jgi:hypothetical protein
MRYIHSENMVILFDCLEAEHTPQIDLGIGRPRAAPVVEERLGIELESC